jgi:hypothetical protein
MLAGMEWGCGAGTSRAAIPYVPRPAAVQDPARTLQETLLASDDEPIKVEVTEAYVLVTNLRDDGSVLLEGVRFRDVVEMPITPYSGAGYAVVLKTPSGDLGFRPVFKDIQRAYRFVDALSAAVARVHAPKGP